MNKYEIAIPKIVQFLTFQIQIYQVTTTK